MKAIVLESFGDVSGLKEKEIPTPNPKKGEVRIKIMAAGFNPVDAKIRKGDFPSSLGIVLGSDCSGVIDALGEGVAEFKIGDEVIALAFGHASNGTYAEVTCVPSAFVCKKPQSLSFIEAATLPVVALTAYRAMVKTGAVKKGSSLFIAGGRGGVGVIAIQLARYLGAGEIFTSAGGEESVNFLKEKLKLKEENILLYRNLSLAQMEARILQMNQGKKVFASFDFVGGEMKQLCLSVADYQGHMVSIVPEKKGFSLDLWTRGESVAFKKNLSVHFIFLGAEAFSGSVDLWHVYQEGLSYMSDLVEKKALTVFAPEVLQGLTLENVQKAHQQMDEGKLSGKIVMAIH